MKTFLCLVLVIFSLVSHITIMPRLGVSYMYHPFPHYIGMLIGIGLLIRLMQKKFTKRRLTATIFSVFMVCFFFWYTSIFSDIDNAKTNIDTDEVAAQSIKQIDLVKIDGARLALGDIFKKNKGTVIVFTRGAW